jgi:hypothetical protein
MNEPRGFNPVADHAPNLPRHDAGLPGHVPGTPFANIGGADDTSFSSAGYRDPNFPPWFGEWSGRVILFVAMYITVPLQVALYPVAGICGIALGLPFYLLGAQDWAWTACFIGLVATMRIETGFEKKFPRYRMMRHALRLGLIFVFMTYFDVHDQGDSFGMAMLLSALFTAFMHFFLRWGLTQGLWDGLQVMGWLRKK